MLVSAASSAANGASGASPASRQRLRRGHLLPVVVGLAGADHRRADVAHLREVALARRAARLHDRRDPLVEQVEQHLGELRRRRLVDHRVRPHGHHRPGDLLVGDLRPDARLRAALERRELPRQQQLLVLRRERVALEDHRLAAGARRAVEPVDRQSLPGALEQQLVGVVGALARRRCQLDLRAVPRDGHHLVDGQMLPVQGDGAPRLRGDDRVVRPCRAGAADAQGEARPGDGARESHASHAVLTPSSDGQRPAG